MAIALMITVHIISKKRGYAPSRDKRASIGEVLKQGVESIWALLFPFGIIAGLRFGLFTPSEAGAIAVLYTILVGFFIYKELKIVHFIEILKDTVYGTSSVVLIIIAANVFGYYMSWERIPQMLTEAMLGITTNPMLMLLLINIFYLILGMFIEGGAALIIISPLLVPVVVNMGIDPVHFGLVTIVNIMIGGITPPFGSMMFTVCTITGTKITTFIKEIWPFIIALVVVLFIITYFPSIVMFLPNLVF